MKDYLDLIHSYVDKEVEVLKSLDLNKINEALNLLEETMEAEKNIYIFGNGGSAATASHFQNDCNKGVSEYTEKKFSLMCLNENVAKWMAISNDIG